MLTLFATMANCFVELLSGSVIEKGNGVTYFTGLHRFLHKNFLIWRYPNGLLVRIYRVTVKLRNSCRIAQYPTVSPIRMIWIRSGVPHLRVTTVWLHMQLGEKHS